LKPALLPGSLSEKKLFTFAMKMIKNKNERPNEEMFKRRTHISSTNYA
jgi:hypothetical protein